MRSEDDSGVGAYLMNESKLKVYKESGVEKVNDIYERNGHDKGKDQTVIYQATPDGNLHTRVTTIVNNDNKKRREEGDEDDKKCCILCFKFK